MKSIINSLLLPAIALATVFTSCKKEDDHSTPAPITNNPGGQAAYFIKGTIYDAQGNKFHVPNSSVIVNAWGPGGIGYPDLNYNMQMDGSSNYYSEVANGIYTFHTRAYMPLNGSTVCIYLESMDSIPSNVGQPSAHGLTKNFKLQLTGLMKGGNPNDAYGYYGGHIWVGDGETFFGSNGYWSNLKINHPGSTVTFTIAPQGLLIDGSAGQTKLIDLSVDDLQTGKYLINFPLALQRISAVLTEQGGQQIALKLTPIPGTTGPHVSYIDETFPPDPDDFDGAPIIPEIAVFEN